MSLILERVLGNHRVRLTEKGNRMECSTKRYLAQEVKSERQYSVASDIRDLKHLRRGRKRERNYDVACSRTLGREHRFRREN